MNIPRSGSWLCPLLAGCTACLLAVSCTVEGNGIGSLPAVLSGLKELSNVLTPGYLNQTMS
jgi:hypothetical protein